MVQERGALLDGRGANMEATTFAPCYRGLALRDVDTIALDLHGARGVKAA
jgi:hypothetical protein